MAVGKFIQCDHCGAIRTTYMKGSFDMWRTYLGSNETPIEERWVVKRRIPGKGYFDFCSRVCWLKWQRENLN